MYFIHITEYENWRTGSYEIEEKFEFEISEVEEFLVMIRPNV